MPTTVASDLWCEPHDLHVLLPIYSTGSLLKHSLCAVDRHVSSPVQHACGVYACVNEVEKVNYTLIPKEKRRAALGRIQTIQASTLQTKLPAGHTYQQYPN